MLQTAKQGFVYVLMNQSLPGCVKIGRTTRDCAARAAELSSATGVPTPFLVAFEAYFENCHEAETYIHTLLESEGVRLASNREFFSITASQAIKAVIQAQGRLGVASTDTSTDCTPSAQSNDALDISSASASQPWEKLLEEGHDYLYGNDEKLEDEEKAIALFKTAAKLGSGQAYVRLGECYQGTVGLDWIKRGADGGHPECWLFLAAIFNGEDFRFNDIPINFDNSRKAYCKYFDIVDVAKSEDRQLFFSLEKYLKLIDGKQNQFDVNAMQKFLPKFLSLINETTNVDEKLEKNNQLTALCKKYL